MPFNQLDTNLFRAFFHASELLNFTEAAKKSGITQSGLSQQIARLETQLGTTLFLRNKKSIQLTETGLILKSFIAKYLEDIEDFLSQINQEQASTSGTVSIGMPESCMMSPTVKTVLHKRNSNFPLLNLDLRLLPSNDIERSIRDGDTNFGFVLNPNYMSGVKYLPFCREELVLAISPSIYQNQEINQLSFIHHPDFASYAKIWTDHHNEYSKYSASQFKIESESSSLASLIVMLEAGIGASFIPKHCINQQIIDKSLIVIPQDQNYAVNEIYLVYKVQKHLPKKISIIVQEFFNEIGKEY